MRSPTTGSTTSSPTTDAVASKVGHALKDTGEVAFDCTTSVGNAMLHDTGSDAMLMGGPLLSAIGGAGEVGGAVLDTTVVLSPADAAHSDHVALFP